MVWQDTTQVGCGFSYARFGDGVSYAKGCGFLVCRYSPPGNYHGQAVCRTGRTTLNASIEAEVPVSAKPKPDNVIQLIQALGGKNAGVRANAAKALMKLNATIEAKVVSG